jgi:hypothetical protein
MGHIPEDAMLFISILLQLAKFGSKKEQVYILCRDTSKPQKINRQ